MGKVFPRQTCNNHLRRKERCELMDQIQTVVWQFFCAALGGASAMGTNTMALIQTCQIQAIMTVPKRLSFSAQLSNCNLATCWHIELSILGLLHLSISIHLSNSFSCSMKFTTEKPWCPVSTFSYFHGKAFLGKPATITFGENKDVNSWIKFRLLYDNSFAPALGGACAIGSNTMALIQICQIQAIMTVPKRLSFSAQLSNCNLATCWRIELSILGLLHLSISIHLSNSFSCSMNSRRKNLDVQWLLFPISMGRLS